MILVSIFLVLALGFVMYLAFHFKREAEAQQEYDALREEYGFDKDFDYDFTDLDQP